MSLRMTERFAAELDAIAEHVEAGCFDGPGGCVAAARHEALVSTLARAYDRYELDGDVAPVRQAAEAYAGDMASLGLRPDPWVWAHLGQLVADLELTCTVAAASPAAPPVGTVWPDAILTIRPEALQALLDRKRREA